MIIVMVSMMVSMMISMVISVRVTCLLVISVMAPMVISMMMTYTIPFSKSIISVVDIPVIIKPIKTIWRSGCIVGRSRGGTIGIRRWGVVGGFGGVVGRLGRIVRGSGWGAIWVRSWSVVGRSWGSTIRIGGCWGVVRWFGGRRGTVRISVRWFGSRVTCGYRSGGVRTGLPHLTVIRLRCTVRTAASNVVSVVIWGLVLGFSGVSYAIVRWLTWGTIGWGWGVIGRFGRGVVRRLVAANGYSRNGVSMGHNFYRLDILDLAMVVILASVSFATSLIEGFVISALKRGIISLFALQLNLMSGTHIGQSKST